jgi:hypothetical protein
MKNINRCDTIIKRFVLKCTLTFSIFSVNFSGMKETFLNPVRKSEQSSVPNLSKGNFEEKNSSASPADFSAVSEKKSAGGISNGVKVTNAAYKVIDFFPESDPLKNRAKDKALVIMENLTLISGTSGWASLQKEKAKTQAIEDIDILLGYFWIGKSQGWLSAINCLIISNEYEKIKKEIIPSSELTQKLPDISGSLILKEAPQETLESVLEKDNKPIEKKSVTNYLATSQQDLSSRPSSHKFKDEKNKVTERQQKILDFLGKNENAQVMDLQGVLSNVTKRTIRRDLDELLRNDKIERLGEFNQVVYKIKG